MAAAHFTDSGIQFFDPEVDARRRRFAQACDEVFAAIECNKVVPYYQPKVNMTTGEVVGAEALVRLHRNGAIVLPANHRATVRPSCGVQVESRSCSMSAHHGLSKSDSTSLAFGRSATCSAA